MHNFIHWIGSEICHWTGYVFWRNMLHGLQHTSAVKGYIHPPERTATLVGDVQLCLGVFTSTTQNCNCNVEPYRLGLAQGCLQAEACSLELSSPTFGYLAAIGCREWAEGGVLHELCSGLVWPGNFLL